MIQKQSDVARSHAAQRTTLQANALAELLEGYAVRRERHVDGRKLERAADHHQRGGTRAVE